MTRGLQKRFGAARVFDTLLDEQSILGLALGAGVGRAAAGAGDPVPGLPAQRRGPAARRGGDPAVLLPRASTATRWSCGSPARPTRRASAATSTTTTPSPCCATSPAWSSPRPSRPDDAAAMLRTCVAAADVDGTRLRVPRADRALPHPRPARGRRRRLAGAVRAPGALGRRPTCPIGRARTYGDGRDLTIVTFGNGVRMSLRVARRLAERGRQRAGCSTCAGWRRCRSTTSCARPTRPAGCWSSTRPAAPAASPRAWSPRWSTGGFTGRDRPGHQRGQLHPARRRRRAVLLSEETIEDAGLRLVAGSGSPPPGGGAGRRAPDL